MKNKKYLILFTLFAMNLVDQPAPYVKIDQGVLSGKISSCGLFHEYLGIPYATTNSTTRFQAPQPPPHWEGVFRATEEIYQCPQNSPIGLVGTEDCLKINVNVPALAHRPLPVMVYIHGGAFIVGSGGKMVYAPDFLLKRDVIVVTFNYRLGPLGFLCLGIEEAPGNAGLKDQVAALKWVKKNIAAFGGDPDNVTIFGHSAGAASTSLLVASHLTDGLFTKAIIISGSSLSHWAMSRDPVLVASKTAKLLGQTINDPKQLYKLFSEMSYKDLISVTADIPMGRQLSEKVLHLPCIDKQFPGSDPVFTDFPYNLLTKLTKNVTLMYGSTNKEGLFLVGEETEETLKKKNKSKLIADDLVFKSEEEEEKVVQSVRNYYFGTDEINSKTLMKLSELYTDMDFEVPVLFESELVGQHTDAPIFIYHFTYSGGRNMVKNVFGFKDEPGACHGDDILYIFKGRLWPFKITSEDEKMIDWMTAFLTNFAKYGHPTPPSKNDLPVQWLPASKEKLNVLYIDKELKLGPIPKPEVFDFWKNIYKKYRKL